ncbi:MAG: shikimate dehydrogenase [Actinomycetia bacterium]|nr:shikimate dehydrogenase [Actinomycetes bacterium]
MSWQPGSHTRLAAVIGDPVRHSLSPAIHNAGFRAAGLDWAYLAFDVPAGGGAAAVEAMRVLGIDGLSVTMPQKAEVSAAVDRLSPAAEALGAVNTVVREGSVLLGENTDGEGFLNALRLDEGVDVAGMRCLVIGAGGAARAVVRALAGAGVAEVVVAARRPEAAALAVALAPGVGRVGSADAADAADLVVNATPVGMGEVVDLTPTLPVEASRLGAGQVVVDLVYHPLITPLVAAARQQGAVAVNGVGMLLHQAAIAFQLWTGAEAPLEAMSAAVLAELAKRPA